MQGGSRLRPPAPRRAIRASTVGRETTAAGRRQATRSTARRGPAGRTGRAGQLGGRPVVDLPQAGLDHAGVEEPAQRVLDGDVALDVVAKGIGVGQGREIDRKIPVIRTWGRRARVRRARASRGRAVARRPGRVRRARAGVRGSERTARCRLPARRGHGAPGRPRRCWRCARGTSSVPWERRTNHTVGTRRRGARRRGRCVSANVSPAVAQQARSFTARHHGLPERGPCSGRSRPRRQAAMS